MGTNRNQPAKVLVTNFEYWFPKQIAASKKYPFTMGQIRHQLLYRHRNGLDMAVRKIGKGLVIRMDLYDSWLESQVSKKRGNV